MLAEKFTITPFRVAAVIQLKHNEEQYRMNGVKLLDEEAAMMDEAIQHIIKLAYQLTGEIPPEQFVEDPARTGGEQESRQFQPMDDVFDMRALVQSAHIREQTRARLLINDHEYIEDVDDSSINVDVNDNVKTLMKRQKRLAEQQQQFFSTKAAAASATSAPATNAATNTNSEEKDSTITTLPFHKPKYTDENPKRPRWKYVAQMVNTRDAKKGAKHQGKYGRKHRATFEQHCTDNTVVEQDGQLRVANMAEAKNIAWKPTRHIQEFIYANVKRGWLDRTVRNDIKAWGKAPVFEKKASIDVSQKMEISEDDAESSSKDGDFSVSDEVKESEEDKESDMDSGAEGSSDSDGGESNGADDSSGAESSSDSDKDEK